MTSGQMCAGFDQWSKCGRAAGRRCAGSEAPAGPRRPARPQPFDQSFDQPFDQSFDQPFDQSFDQPFDPSFDQSFDQPFDQPF